MKTTLVLSLLFLLPFVAAANTTMSQNVTVNLTCGVEQCIITGPGIAAFFPNTNSSQTYSVPVLFSFENVTIENVTIVQNVSNVTVITQVVNVTNCEARNVTVSTEDLSRSITDSIVNVCTTACSPGQSMRDQWNIDLRSSQEAERQCQQDRAATQAKLDIITNTTDIRLAAQNETLTAQIQKEQEGHLPWIILTVIALIVAAGVLGIVLWKSRSTNNAGSSAEPDLPELKS